MGFIRTIKHFANWKDQHRPSINTATVEVTEETARKALGIRKAEPLTYRGLTLRCIGSRRWRQENAR
jgi:hypothetical protein